MTTNKNKFHSFALTVCDARWDDGQRYLAAVFPFSVSLLSNWLLLCSVWHFTPHMWSAFFGIPHRQQDFWLLVLNVICIYNFKLEWPRSSYRIREGLITLNTRLNHRKTWKDKLEDYEVIRPLLTLFWCVSVPLTLTAPDDYSLTSPFQWQI